MDPSLIISAFIAGLFTFLAPCTLPLVPAYLGFISGVKKEELESNDSEIRKATRKKMFLNGVFFILGFTLIFVIFGTIAGLLGQSIVGLRIWLTRIGGAFVVLFGLFMLGVFNLPFLQGEHRLKMPRWLELGKPHSSFIVGGTFAFGWTPCVGPILGTILFLASAKTTALQGGLLLSVFSLGLAIPFIIIALAYSKASQYITVITKYIRWVSIIGGLFLIALGILLITNNFSLLIQFGYILFDFINYEEILNKL